MTDIEIDGMTYTTDPLTYYMWDTETGEWKASLLNHYHAVGLTKYEAISRLAWFLRSQHPEVWEEYASCFPEACKK